MRYNKTRKVLIFWCLFIGIGALYGSICMLIDPTGKLLGMDQLLPYFEVLPFSKILFKNYIFSGFSLLIVNGITNITASILLIKNKKTGIILGSLFGITLMLWITIQFIIFPPNIMSISYFIFGFIQAVTGYMCYVFYLQENFRFCINDYQNIGTNKNEIVVYFSRMGYTKKIAYEIANKSGAQILELQTTEYTKNTIGFWWCGRFGMHKWPMNLIEISTDFSKYNLVTLCTPIWVFGLSAPMRKFCMINSGKIKNVNYVITHFMKASFIKVADEMDYLLKNKRKKLTTICVRFGKIKSLKEKHF